MKRRNRILCLVLSALMVLTVSGALLVSAESYRVDSGSESGVVYNGETVESFNVHTLTFNSDDYVVLPFSGYAGGTYTLNGQYSQAVALGYDVVGIVNGDFFSMSNGYLTDYIVTNGEVIIGDAAYHSSMTCIMPDGTFTTVTGSQLKFATYFNDVEVSGGISYVNRRPNRNAADGWTNALYYFDSNAASDKCPLAGVAVICKRTNGTVLSIGGTMTAEVVSVEKVANANGINPEKDQFLLYVRESSPLAKTLLALKAGDAVSVTTSEKVAASAETVSNATSILANIGYLVKDGKNLAAEDAFNKTDPHGNKYKAQWTAFGTKEDGSWMFFTSEGASGSSGLTQAQVAAYLLSEGCTDVIRLDGGGSVAMYVSDLGDGNPGYKENHGRHVPDCLMVVKRSSKALQPSDETVQELDKLIAEAEGSSNEHVQAALAYAKSIANGEKSVSGDYISAVMQLRYALSGEADLGDPEEVFVDKDGTKYPNVTANKSYTVAGDAYGGTWTDTAEDGSPIGKWTDGITSHDGNDPRVGCWTVKDGKVEVTIDLGDTYAIKRVETDLFGNLSWGIADPSGAKVHFYTSTDGKSFTAFGDGSAEDGEGEGGWLRQVFSYTSESTVEAAYVKVVYEIGGKFCWVSEITAFGLKKENEEPTPTDAMLGDLDGNGKIDKTDYMFLKRAVLGTYRLTDAQKAVADVNKDGKINSVDYIQVKRHVLGTYKIPAPKA